MRTVIVLVALLAVAASSRDGCGSEPAQAPYEPCAGKACGAECTVCDPADPDCAETAVLKACDASGRCDSADAVSCPPVDPCAGKGCGASCNPCGDAHPCPTVAATACDRAGRCVTETPWICHDPCAGRACHAPCTPCPPGAPGCAAVTCVTWCAADGRCVCAVEGGGDTCP